MKPREGLGAGGRPERPKKTAGWWAGAGLATAAVIYIAVDAMDYWDDVWHNGPINRGGSHGDQSDTSERTRRAPAPVEDAGDPMEANNEAPADDAEAAPVRPERSPELVLQTIQMTGLEDGERMVGILAIDRHLLPRGIHAPAPRGPEEADLLDRARDIIDGHERHVGARDLVLVVVDQAPPAVDGVTQVQFPRVAHIDGQDINLEELQVPEGRNGFWFAAVPEHHEAYVDIGGRGNDHLRITGHALGDGEHARHDRRDEGEHHGRRGHRPHGG